MSTLVGASESEFIDSPNGPWGQREAVLRVIDGTKELSECLEHHGIRHGCSKHATGVPGRPYDYNFVFLEAWAASCLRAMVGLVHQVAMAELFRVLLRPGTVETLESTYRLGGDEAILTIVIDVDARRRVEKPCR